MALEPSDEHPVRLQIWERYATGKYTLASLARALNAEGHTIRGRPFTKFTLHEILRRDLDVKFGGLPREVYERVQSILASRKGKMIGKRRHRYLFADMARCAECGERMIGRAFWRPGASEPVLQVKHPDRGCKHGIRNESMLRERIGEWLDGWRLPGDVRARIARYLRRKAPADPDAARRRRVEVAIEQLRKQHQWGALTDQDFLTEHATLAQTLAELAPPTVPAPPSTEALKMADRIGSVWRKVSDERRREFLFEWFSEIRIAADGALTMVPRSVYAPIVYAAVANVVVPVGCAGFEPATLRM